MRNENTENLRSFAQLVLKISLVENWQVRQIFGLTLKAPIPQNGQTYSSNSSAIADGLFECV